MSKATDPIKLQSYLTICNKKFIKPAKTFVKEKIAEPAQELAKKQPLIKEYITDPIINASTGKQASDAKWIANEVKNKIKDISEPFLPSGLTEADLPQPDGRYDGYVYVHDKFEREPNIVETDEQRKAEDWEEDTWEYDETSIFKPSSNVPSSQGSILQYNNAKGQVQVMVLEDITEDLLTPERKEQDVYFRSSELFEISREDKVLSSEYEADRDVRFGVRDMESDRFVNPADIKNFANARQLRRALMIGINEPRYRCQRQNEEPGVPLQMQREVSHGGIKGEENPKFTKRQISRDTHS